MRKSALILGYGVSGKSAEAFFKHHGLPYEVYDDAHPNASLEARVLNSPRSFSEIIVSPGISPSHKFLTTAAKHNLPIKTEVDLGLATTQARVIAITGTNGKSSTSALIDYGLKSFGMNSLLAGNIGEGLCSKLQDSQALPDYIVLELSSFQLHYMHPHAMDCAVFTNFSPDHEEWHGDRKAYFSAKWKLTHFLKTQGVLIVSRNVLSIAQEYGLQPRADVHTVVFDDPVTNTSFASAAVGAVTQKSSHEIHTVLRGFEGLPHRLQRLGTYGGFDVINDSKSTNFDSLNYALKTQLNKPTYVFIGGRLKTHDFEWMVHLPKQKTDHILQIIAFGENHKIIEKQLSRQYPVKAYAKLETALNDFIKSKPLPAAQILFSPGGSSYDEFNNFADRGRFFHDKISQIMDSVGHAEKQPGTP